MRKWMGRIGEWGLGIAIVVGAVWFYVNAQPAEKNTRRAPGAPPVVSVAVLQMRPVNESLPALGTLSANESVEITATAAEKILAIHFNEGEFVHQGDLLVQLDNLQELATLKEASIVCEEAQREAARATDLLNKRAIASKEYDAQITRMAAANAARELVQANLRDRRVEAPFDGVIGRRLVSPGHLVTPGTRITTLDDLRVMKVDFTVPEKYLVRVVAGRDFSATSAAYPGRRFTGTILMIDPQVDVLTRSVRVRGTIENADLALRGGMLLGVEVELAAYDALIIPEKAVLSLGEKQYVYVVDAQNIAHSKEVKLGNRRAGMVEVTAGLTPGELLVVEGSGKLSDGLAVTLSNEVKP